MQSLARQDFQRPILLLLSDSAPDTKVVSVSLEHTPIVLSDIRQALPNLKKVMRKKWPALNDVYISHSLPRGIRSHLDRIPRLVGLRADAPLCLAASFALGVGGRKSTKPPSREIEEYLRCWIQKFTKSKPNKKSLNKAQERIFMAHSRWDRLLNAGPLNRVRLQA